MRGSVEMDARWTRLLHLSGCDRWVHCTEESAHLRGVDRARSVIVKHVECLLQDASTRLVRRVDVSKLIEHQSMLMAHGALVEDITEYDDDNDSAQAEAEHDERDKRRLDVQP